MKRWKELLFLPMFGVLAVAGCSNSDIYIPLSSDSLVDQSIAYSDDVLDKEGKPLPLARSRDRDATVVIAPKAAPDENIEFKDESYVAANDVKSSPVAPVERPAAPKVDDFDEAIAEAESRHNIPKSAPVVAVLPAPASAPAKTFDKKLVVGPAPVKRIKDVTFLSTVIYHSNTMADLSARDTAALREVARFAKSRDADIMVVGHSSSRTRNMREIENKLENFGLSARRANRVADELARLGFPRSKITMSAVSDTEQVLKENMPMNEAVNRRTEVYVSY
ncbi:MAG: OmpA family protein [Rickettsiales bacterium]|jgi:outer membrane protein OmpA-like peptidoglycan-associated protein|nr:OmpA family protein [Rickettsiales bacterium]